MIIILKRELSLQHSEQHYPARPDICFESVIELLAQHFWGCVAKRATESLQKFTT